MGQLARGCSQLAAQAVVIAQVQHRLHKGAGGLRFHTHTTALNETGNLAARFSSRNHRPAAGQHATQFGRHHQVGRVAQLWQQVDVCHHQQGPQFGCRAQVQEAHVAQARRSSFQRGAHLAATAQHKDQITT